MTQESTYLTKDKRKKILFIGDDIRFHSGIATISRELLTGTADHFNYLALGGSINHPDKGKKFDLSAATNQLLGIDDANIFLLPVDGYGSPELLRDIIKYEPPDAIVFITDPRYYQWLFAMEHEIRQKVPMVYISIWDEFPAPLYNKPAYHSVDMLLCISKQTVLISNQVLGEDKDDVRVKYFPHGINSKNFRPLEDNDIGLLEIKKQLFGTKEYDFVLFFNSRNIRRKSIPDMLLAFKAFLRKLPKEKADKCAFVLHTQPVDDNGTDLYAVIEMLFGDRKDQIIFSNVLGTVEYMNILYNIADATVLVSSNEGFGLSGAESIMAGTPVIGNVTGGIQDYARFEDTDGNWFTPNDDVWSMHNGNSENHKWQSGCWFFPVFPSNLSIQGSVPTPYIFDSRADFKDVALKMEQVYGLKLNATGIGRDVLPEWGLDGREWLMSEESKMSSDSMCSSFINYMDELLENWEPRHEYEIITIDSPKKLKTLEFPDYLFEYDDQFVYDELIWWKSQSEDQLAYLKHIEQYPNDITN